METQVTFICFSFFICSVFCAVPDSVQPTLRFLPEYENETEYTMGSYSKLELTAAFPAGITSGVNIELLPSTNVTTTVMALGDITVTKVGSNLQGFSMPPVVRYATDESLSNVARIYNRGVFTIGDIDNNGVSTNYDESTIKIEFEAVVASISDISDNFIHWVSTGVEFNNSYNVWIGQVSHTIRTLIPSGSENATYEMSDVGEYTLEIKSMKKLQFKAWVPYPSATVSAEAIVLTNTTDNLHVIDIRLADAGDNYKYMMDLNKTIAYQTSCTRSNRKRVELGSLYNKGALEGPYVKEANLLLFEATLYLEEGAQDGDVFSVGVGIEVDASEVWVTHLNMTAVAGSSSAVPSSHTLELTPQGSTNILIGDGVILEANLTITENTSMSYTVDVETTRVTTGDPGLMVALVEITSSGENIPCIPTPTVTYTPDADGFLNKGTLNANITNYGLLTGALGVDTNAVTIRIVLAVIPGKAVDGEDYRVSVKVTSADSVEVTQTQDYSVVGTAPYDTSVNYTFSLYHKCIKNCITLGSTFEFFIDVTTERDSNPGPVVFEFPVPANVTDSIFSVCEFEIIDIGKNTICVNSQAAVSASNLTSLGDGTYERVRMLIPALCNVGIVNDTKEDMFTVRIMVNIRNDSSVTDGTVDWFGAGVKYSETQIWVAQYKVLAKAPTYYADLALVEGIVIDAADAANISWPGNNTVQTSIDGDVYASKAFSWTSPSNNGSHDVYMLPQPFIGSYVRLIVDQCKSGCYVDHDFISKTLDGYIEIFNDSTGSYKRQLAVALDDNNATCFNLPVQGSSPPVFWGRFNTTILEISPQSFRLSVTGEGISCLRHGGTKVLQVSYSTSSSIEKFHGDLEFCKSTSESTNDGKTSCLYECNCPDAAQCSEIFIFLANGMEGDTSPWTLCELSAANM